MSAFTDVNGKAWVLQIDTIIIEAGREELGIDLAAMDGALYQRLVDDPCLLVNTLFLVCREQAQEANIDGKAFARAIYGDLIEHAVKALLDAIKAFSPTRRRELLSAVAEKAAKVRELGMAKALEKINDPALQERIVEAMNAEMDELVERALRRSTQSP